MDEPTVEDARNELEQARRALHDAQVLFDSGGSDAGTLNRLYYAVFHAAQAALYARGENPSSHGHVRQQFGQQLVLNGDASREEGRLLSTLYDYRQEADYGGEISDVNVEPFIEDVEEFITHMDRLVDAADDAERS